MLSLLPCLLLLWDPLMMNLKLSQRAMHCSWVPCSSSNRDNLSSALPSAFVASPGHGPALVYSRSHFGPFQHRHISEIQRLMGCLLFSRRVAAGGMESALGPGPYADLLASSALWEQAAQGFWQIACGLLGQVSEIFNRNFDKNRPEAVEIENKS